jgi:hypothetical protein
MYPPLKCKSDKKVLNRQMKHDCRAIGQGQRDALRKLYPRRMEMVSAARQTL